MMNPANDVAPATMRDRYLGAMEFGEMLATVTKHEALWAAVWRRGEVPEDLVQRLAATGGGWHFLVLSEDWCGDAVNSVPLVARLAELAPNADVRVLARDENLDLMDAHLTGTSRSIPVVMVLDEDYTEVGWWGPRPAAELHPAQTATGGRIPTWVLIDRRSCSSCSPRPTAS